MTDLHKAVAAHAALFNAAVISGDWTAFVATFAEDAIMRFANVPVGPFHGRASIARAYEVQPPDDTMTVRSVEELEPEVAEVDFAWNRGGSGTMTVRWRAGEVADLTIAFT